MADDPQTPPENDEELLLTEEHIPEGDPEEVEIPAFGDEAEPHDTDTGLVKHLRQQIRERDKRLAERTTTPQAVDPGPEPTLEGCEYDEDKYRAAIREYDKAVADAEKPRVDSQAAAAHKYETERARYTDGKAKLGVPDIDDAEETVKAALSPEQQSVLVLASDDPAKMVYALGKNPAKLAEIASEADFFRFAAKVAKLEGQLKMVKRRTAPNPDTPERGSARMSPQTTDKKLKKLEEDAERTGDRTELVRYRKQLKAAN